MSYEKYTWETGEVITADKLNHLEGGVENNSIIIVNSVESTGQYATILNMTWREIYDLFMNKRPIFIYQVDGDIPVRCIFVTEVSYTTEQYSVYGATLFAGVSSGIRWDCRNEDEYPHIIND